VFTIQGGLTSCKKDTVIIKDTVLTEDLLTAHPWKMQELRGVLEGTVLFYSRGGSGNTINYDNDYVVFNTDKTGYGVDGANATHDISHWELLTTDKTTLVFTIYNTPSITSVITWDNIRYKNGNMYYDDYYTDNYVDKDFHGQEIRIPK